MMTTAMALTVQESPLGLALPDYQHIGVAPRANLVGVKVLDGGGSGSFAAVMAGMEWTVEKRHEFNIRAASMSLGALNRGNRVDFLGRRVGQ